MSIRTREKEWGADLPAGTECFYCYQPIAAVAIFWMGNECDLWLHPECVVELTIRLFRDVHEYEIGTHTYVARNK